MTRKSTQSLIDAAKKGVEQRPAGRLQSMFGKEPPKPIAVPLEDDTYEIDLKHIKPHPDQPRKTFDQKELNNLAASIKENGVLQHLIVRQSKDPEIYELIAGERRLRAAKIAGLLTVPCIVKTRPDKSLDLQRQLVENIQRADLEPIEAARSLQKYLADNKLNKKQASTRLGKDRAWIVELLTILKLPDKLLEKGKRLPKITLVKIARSPTSERSARMDKELSARPESPTTPSRRQRKPRTLYYRESFPLESAPPIEVRWKKHPDEVRDLELADALNTVITSIKNRRRKSK